VFLLNILTILVQQNKLVFNNDHELQNEWEKFESLDISGNEVSKKDQSGVNRENKAEENPESNNNLYVNSDYNSCNQIDEDDNNILQREEDIDQE
jgi:hypothetical protein